MRALAVISILLLTACSRSPSDQTEQILSFKDDDQFLNIVFSHNINGETHSCGCRQFPLGGLGPLAGAIDQVKQSGPTLYLDSGNAFFPSMVVPDHVKDSLHFTANNLARGLDKLGLRYFLPGAQDFAAGSSFLKDLIAKNNFQVLAANLTEQGKKDFNGLSWLVINHNDHKIFITGLVSTQRIQQNVSAYFSHERSALKEVLQEMEQAGLQSDNPRHRLIVLSSAGISDDTQLAQDFPQINWIIGSHSQSFLQRPRRVNGVNIVQTLSRNHYLGHIQLDLQKGEDSYRLIEVSEALEELISPNPLTQFLDRHLKELAEVRRKEQQRMAGNFSSEDKFLPSAASCIECHQAQGEKWMETAHSMAFHTLIKAQASNNLSCIECHSVGLNDPHGFQRAQDIVLFRQQLEHTQTDQEKIKKMRQNYWQAVEEQFQEIDSVRALRPRDLRSFAQKWQQLDLEFNVAHNFSGVQCLNCHDQPLDHPFDFGTERRSSEQRKQVIQNNCLACHDADQSPQWYLTDERGLANQVNQEVLERMYYKVACPSLRDDKEN